MKEQNKLALARNHIIGVEEFLSAAGLDGLLIDELDERLELAALLISEVADTNALVCGGGNTNCAGANCVAGCT